MLRTFIIAASASDMAQAKDMLRTLSLAATALTRLIQTENWLSQTTGAQVQIDDRPRAYNMLKEVFRTFHQIKQRRLAPPGDQEDEQEDGQEDDHEDDQEDDHEDDHPKLA